VWKSFEAKSVSKVFVATVSELRSFYVDVACFVMIVDLHKMETIHFNITCQFISLVTMKEKIQQILPFAAFFSRNFIVFLIEHFSVRVVGTCQTCYRYYCPSVITALKLSVLPRTLSGKPPSNDHNNTKRHEGKNVVTRKRRRI
jgi:hypothetical protein